MTPIDEFYEKQDELISLRGELERIQKDRAEYVSRLERENKDLLRTRKAQQIIQHVGKATQEKLQFQISELVTLALSSVFGEDMEFGVEFVLKRNQSEAELFFLKKGEKIDPMTESGGGVIDIASFALRVCMWGLQAPRSRNLIVLDEPFKHLSRNLIQKAGEMLRKLSSKLDLQLLLITHEKEIVDCADKVFYVDQKNGVSEVKEKE